MKKTQASKQEKKVSDDLKPEYQFNYAKRKPNRFAGKKSEKRVVVVLDPDVAVVFTTPESVNNALRGLITANQAVEQK